MTLQKGHIYFAKKEFRNKHVHPIVILEDDPNNTIACVLSTKNVHDNILMSEDHFESNYEIKYEPSYLINVKFIKAQNEINDTVRGEITDKGMDFLEDKLRNLKGEILNAPIWERKITDR